MSLALLLAGCGEEEGKNIGIPKMIDCDGCNKEVYSGAKDCPKCAYPVADSIDAYKEAQELARIRAEEERKAKPFGGLEVLAKIKRAKESGAADLVLGGNKISDLSPLKGLTGLKGLSLYDNQITDLSPLKELTNLEVLNLYNSQITDISPLKGLKYLEYLNLYQNKISDISPLAELTNLEMLYLNLNQISDLSPLAVLTNLKTLNLQHNQITDLSPLKGLTNLERLYLSDNEISEDQKAMIKKALPKCYIEFIDWSRD